VLIATLVGGALMAAGAIAWVRSTAEPSEAPEVAGPPEVHEPIVEERPIEDAPLLEAEEEDPVITRVQIDTVPAGAHLSRDGRDLGDAPSALVVPFGESWEIAISAPGYETRNVTITGGQQAITVQLDREPRATARRRARRVTRDTAMATAMEPANEPSVEASIEARPVMTEPAMSPRTRRSENRDPWAR